MLNVPTATLSLQFAKLRCVHTKRFFAFLAGLSKATRRVPCRTSSIVYSIKLLPTGRTPRLVLGTAGSQEYLSLIRTLIRALRKVHDTTSASLRGKTFSVLFEKTRNHRVVGSAPLDVAVALRAAATWLPIKPRDTIEPRIHKGR